MAADGLSATKSLACGMTLGMTYGADPRYRFTYLKQETEKAPSGLTKTSVFERTYQDTDSDGVPDLITRKATVNSKATTSLLNTLLSTRTFTSPLGRTVSATYDPATLLTQSVSVPGLFDTHFDYDARGRLTSVSSDTRESTFGYDVRGNLASVTDALGRATSYTHDEAGRVLGVERPDGSTLSFAYDANGNLTLLDTPAGVSHTFGYNKVNLDASYLAPLSGTTSYTYDRDRRLTRIRFPSGREIENTYTAGNLTRTDIPEGATLYGYYCAGKVKSITRGTEVVSYLYDGSLPTTETLAGTLGQSITYVYNTDFNVSRMTYAGASNDFTYDNDGLMTKSGAFTIGRNASNGLPETVGNGTFKVTRTFNGYGEIASEAHTSGSTPLPSYVLTRDDVGRITSKAEQVGSTVTAEYAYAYDALGRLVSVTKDGILVEEYHYGANGARISETNTRRGVSRDLTYSEEDHLLTAGGTTYQYDLDGFLTTKTSGSQITSYAYSSNGELLSVALPDGRLIEYVNDPLGRRIAKKVSGVVTEKYLWQGVTRLLAVYNGSNTLLMRFQYADARTPVAVTKSGTTYNLIYDLVGTLRAVVNTSGTIIKALEHDSFGNLLSDSNPTFTVPFGFAGGLADPDTGLVHFGYRDYDPDTAHWTAKDPIGFAGGDTDLFAYVQSDPVNLVDPEGLWAWGDPLPQGVVDFSAGWGDMISFGITNQIRNVMGTNGVVNRCSAAYTGGEAFGFVNMIAVGGAFGAEAAEANAGRAGFEFSHWIPARMGGPRSIFNGNFVSQKFHYLTDYYRYPSGWRAWGPKLAPALQQILRIPWVYDGAAAGAAYGAASAMAGRSCECH